MNNDCSGTEQCAQNVRIAQYNNIFRKETPLDSKSRGVKVTAVEEPTTNDADDSETWVPRSLQLY